MQIRWIKNNNWVNCILIIIIHSWTNTIIYTFRSVCAPPPSCLGDICCGICPRGVGHLVARRSSGWPAELPSALKAAWNGLQGTAGACGCTPEPGPGAAPHPRLTRHCSAASHTPSPQQVKCRTGSPERRYRPVTYTSSAWSQKTVFRRALTPTETDNPRCRPSLCLLPSLRFLRFPASCSTDSALVMFSSFGRTCCITATKWFGVWLLIIMNISNVLLLVVFFRLKILYRLVLIYFNGCQYMKYVVCFRLQGLQFFSNSLIKD